MAYELLFGSLSRFGSSATTSACDGWRASREVPFALVTSIAIVCAIVLARNDATGPHPLRVNVTA
jgi:hypothetical protein